MKRQVASIIMAAGRGSRMKGYDGNKTLLPLKPGKNPLEGKYPILLNIIKNLPEGPKAIVVHHRKHDIIKATKHLQNISYYEQEVLNGTGGALLSAKGFIHESNCEFVVVTMGDVPFLRSTTYEKLIRSLADVSMVVLAFKTDNKRQYGLLRIVGDCVKEIIEWKYWNKMTPTQQNELELCNSGIYAMRRSDLISFLPALSQRPHMVEKEVKGRIVQFHEFFITDLVTIMIEGGKKVGYTITKDEDEVMGVDDLDSLIRAQKIFNSK